MAAIKLDHTFFSQDAQAGGFFPATHINPGFDIDAFISGNGQNLLVEGIRGTGKTHILKMIASRCIETYPENRILPVYISLAEVSEWAETSDWSEKNIQIFRIQLYASMVSKTISTIETNKDKIRYKKDVPIGKIDKLKSMFGIKADHDLDYTLNDIKNLNEALLRRLTYNPEQILEIKKVEEKEQVSAGLKVQPTQIKIDELSGFFEERDVKSIGKNLSYDYAAKFIIEFFKQLRELLCYKHVILLLDECSETSDEAQVEIFRLLKLIRGALTSNMEENYAYFCASVYPPYSTNYPSKIKGNTFNFDPGHDASVEYLQLDELSDEYETFFRELTRKRLELVFGRSVSEPINEIFENEGAFVLATYAANGIPRRYLEILNQGYSSLCQRSSSETNIEKISQKDIESAIQVLVASQILSRNKLTSIDFKIIDDISQRVSKRNKKTETENKEKAKPLPANVYFTINYSQFEQFNNLLLQGCVHDKGRTRLKKYYKDEGSQGPLFMLDLSLALHNGAIDKRRAIEIYRSDLKKNAKSGYLYCQDFNLDYLT